MVRTRRLIPAPTILLPALLLAALVAAEPPARSLEARRAAWTPRIDGELEPAWAFAD
jgi:hypothetical protein